MNEQTTIDSLEVTKFAAHAETWWDPNGPLKTLHDINPVRMSFIESHCSLSGIRVLDVGCGGGILSEALAQKGACVTGIDVATEALLVARKHAVMSGLSLDYIEQPIELFDAPAFDCITCLEMLEHVSHPERVVEHASRLLKPDGIFFLSTISRTWKAYASVIVAAEYLLSLLPRQTHDFDKFIRPSELARSLRSNGFEVIDVKGLDYNPFTRIASLGDSVDVNYLMVARRV